MSLLVLVITALRRAGYLKDIITLEHYHIMGKWMLAFTIFWAYIGFGQYMLIWYANIPEETEFFITRNTESWWALSMLLVVGRFFICFGILLLQGIKKKPRRLCWVAGWILSCKCWTCTSSSCPRYTAQGCTSASGFAFPHRHRSNARFCLSANCASDCSLSSSRSAPD